MANAQLTKIIAVIVVIAVVGGAGAVYLVSGNGGSDNDKDKIGSELSIYGNANNDYTIDDKDVTLIRSLIGKDFEKYPYADVDLDGKITEEDALLAEKIVKRESMTLTVVCLDKDADPVKMSVKYPLTNYVPCGTNMILPLVNIGLGDKCIAYFYSNYNVSCSGLAGIDLEGPSRGINDASWQKFTNVDTATPIDCVLVSQDFTGFNTGSYRDDLRAAVIPELRFSTADAYYEAQAMLTIGYLFGTESEAKGVDYARATWDVINHIEDKLSKMAESDKRTFISFTMGNFICQTESTYNQTPLYTGGIPYGDVDAAFKSAYTGTGSTKMASTEALSNYHPDKLISNRSLDYCKDAAASDAKIVSEWEKYIGYFKDIDEYDQLYYVNNLLPAPCRTAYVAYAMYPEIFTLEWADGVLSDCMSWMSTFDNIDRDQVLTVFCLEDYRNAKAAVPA